jgi:signal transduction histidine kinase
MLAGILFLAVVLAVAVLITVDVLRTPNEAAIGQPDWYAHDGAAVQAFSREPVVREQSGPAPAPRAGPAEVDAFERPDQPARDFDHRRHEMPLRAGDDDALRGRSSGMFVNLSRRSQALVERQLRVIESLEHGEQDQQRLASLSRLNRIAMRIHRNSQNLLVLVGQESAMNWNQPVTLAHLVEAAVSEIEDYERVSFEVQPDIAVRGPAVHDAVHLLVELIDNAASFSAADMPVYVRGRVLTTGGALVDITDRGIGMAAKEMAYANQQLDNPPPPDVDVPKWMGLLVVARLAARHGIRVRLNQTDLGGLTALVWFPDEILTHYPGPGDLGQPAGTPRGAAATSSAFASARADSQVAQPKTAWPARNPQSTVQVEPATVHLAGYPDAAGGGLGVVVPQAEGQPTMRRLPFFEEAEPRWSGGAHEAPGPVGLAAAAGPPAGGLPRRPVAGTQASRTVPVVPPGASARPGTAGRHGLTGFRRGGGQGGVGQGWATSPDEANPGPDES